MSEKKIIMDSNQDKHREDYRRWRTRMMQEEAGFFALYQDFEPFLSILSAAALRVYLYLGMHSDNWTGESWHSLDTMAGSLHMDPRTVRRALHELVEEGLIARIQLTPRGRTFTYLRPLPRTRSLMGKALESAAEALVVDKGYAIVEQQPSVSPRGRADLLVEDENGKQFLVEIKYRISLGDVMTWANAARRVGKGLIMVAAEPWSEDVADAAKDWQVILFRATLK